MEDTRPQGGFKALGTSGLVRFSGYVYDEWLPELQGPKGRRVLREMSDNDPIIGAILFSIEMLIRQTVWTIAPGIAASQAPGPEQDPVDPRAEFVESCLHDMISTFPDTLSEILLFLSYGWSLNELCYKRRNGVDSKYTDGLIGWHSWPARGQETLLKWQFGDDGSIEAMVQLGPPDYEEHTIPLTKAMLFRTTVRRGNPEGRSILRNAYRAWFFKKHIENLEGIGIERDYAGLPIAWVPPEILMTDATEEDQQQRSYFEEMVTNIRRDEQEGILMPLAYDENGNKVFDLTAFGSGGRRQFDTDSVIDRYNEQILMSCMADMIMLGHQETGSNALAQSKSKLFTAALGAWLDMICAVINDKAIPDLLRLNGMSIDDPPRLEHGDVERADLDSLGLLMLNLAQAGFQLDKGWNSELLAHILGEARLPQPPEGGIEISENDLVDDTETEESSESAPETPELEGSPNEGN